VSRTARPAVAPATEYAVAGWLAARRHGVPSSMVAAAAGRRAAGDWRGACAAARIDVAIDLDDTANRHGRAVADSVRDDLEHLVPDLVRWHLPRRANGGSGLLEPALVVPLALYGTAGSTLALRVHTPAHLERSQRLLLRLAAVGYGPELENTLVERWDHTRFRWDARHTGDLLRHVGGGDRAPFHHRDGRRLTDAELPPATWTGDDPVRLAEWVTRTQDASAETEAWAGAGIELDLTALETMGDWARWADLRRERSAAVATLLPLLRAERDRRGEPYEAVLAAFGSWWRRAYLKVTVDHDVRAEIVKVMARDAPIAVPVGWWSRSPDLELLRLDRLPHRALHPLVRAALFPDEPAAGGSGPAAEPYAPAAGPDPGRPVPVRCTGGWHDVRWQPGGFRASSHHEDEARREQTLASLGGPVHGCFAVARAWRGPDGRLPRPLREIRSHLIAAIAHDDIEEVERLLAAGVDPVGVRDRVGRTLLHGVGRLGRASLVPRLVAAGIGVDDRADPHAVSFWESGALHHNRSRDADLTVPWLLAAGLDIEGHDLMGRTPLLTAIAAAAPAEAIRALLDAGADPTAHCEYADTTLEQLVFRTGRDDLGFLLEAYRARKGEA
jgi:hypothetical protein